jgi:hypothetical protein
MKQSTEPLIVLQRAVKLLKQEAPWAPVHALKDRVKRGEIPSTRSSKLKGARWYVRMSDLRAAIEKMQKQVA